MATLAPALACCLMQPLRKDMLYEPGGLTLPTAY